MEVFLGFSPEREPEAETAAKVDRSEIPTPSASAGYEDTGMEMEMRARPGGSAGGGQEQQRGSDAASTCTLWCTVAMGALVQGQPPERVRLRLRLVCSRSRWLAAPRIFACFFGGLARAAGSGLQEGHGNVINFARWW